MLHIHEEVVCAEQNRVEMFRYIHERVLSVFPFPSHLSLKDVPSSLVRSIIGKLVYIDDLKKSIKINTHSMHPETGLWVKHDHSSTLRVNRATSYILVEDPSCV